MVVVDEPKVVVVFEVGCAAASLGWKNVPTALAPLGAPEHRSEKKCESPTCLGCSRLTVHRRPRPYCGYYYCGYSCIRHLLALHCN